MSSLRYGLIEQLHFPAADPATPDQDVIVTIQRWRSKTSKTEVFVRAHDGVEFVRHSAHTDAEHARIDESFEQARRVFDQQLLSDEAAADEIARRGGPRIGYCNANGCGAQIPYAGAQCADGHAGNYVNPGTYVMSSARRTVVMRRPS